MKNLVIVVILAAIGYALYAYAWPALEKTMAGQTVEDRVKGWLTSQKAGDEQTALCMWAKGKPMLSQQEMAAYTDKYDAFRRSLEIYSGVNSFSINSVEDFNVSVTINGRSHNLTVDPMYAISVR